MKKQRILVTTVVAAFLIGWWLLKPSSQRRQENKIASAESTNATSNRVQNGPALISSNVAFPASLIDTNAEIQDRFELRKKGAELRNVSINFWGKVVDQDGQPLTGVKIHLHTKDWFAKSADETSANFPRYELESDADGSFQIMNTRGDSLTIDSIEKEGYEFSSKAQRSFGYTRPEKFVPDPQNPVVFKMWKKMGAERLVLQNRNIRIPYDGTPSYFDLTKGIKVGSNDPSDIRVTLLRTPLKVLRGGKQKYDWVVQVAAVQGGIILVTSEFMYLAPETGYIPSFGIEMTKENPNWNTHKSVSFYIKSRGTFGRVTLEFRTDSDRENTGFTLNAAINPSGSRNLEYDPKVYLAP